MESDCDLDVVGFSSPDCRDDDAIADPEAASGGESDLEVRGFGGEDGFAHAMVPAPPACHVPL
eukprot:6795289-Pyramimonas_sp.AAC.1